MPYIQRDENGKIVAMFACEQYENQEYLPDDNEEVVNFGKPTKQELINQESEQFLNDTDWKVIRHRDQLALGIITSLTEAEFVKLLEDRQQARDQVIKE